MQVGLAVDLCLEHVFRFVCFSVSLQTWSHSCLQINIFNHTYSKIQLWTASTDIHFNEISVSKQERLHSNSSAPAVCFLTGLDISLMSAQCKVCFESVPLRHVTITITIKQQACVTKTCHQLRLGGLPPRFLLDRVTLRLLIVIVRCLRKVSADSLLTWPTKQVAYL